MEHKTMNVTLSPQAAEILRALRDRHPELSATEILEEALTERFGRELRSHKRSPEDIRAWLDELASLSDRIPPRPGETFSRELIYQDHD